MSDHFDVIIAGGGVMGASIAWRLARNHLRVLLCDARTIGSEASSAAAGMLAPGGEFDDPSMLDLATRSLASYPDFIRSIEADSGLPIEFRQTSALEIVLTGAAPLSSDQLRALVPLVRRDAIGAIYYPNEAIIDPAALMRSLRAACLARGVCIQEESPVKSISATASGVQVSNHTARFAVLAAGAWSSSIAITIDREPYSIPRTFPIKGHLLGYRLPAGSLATTIRHDHTYILQRADGFTIAGSSTEDAGFDRTIDPTIVSDLTARAGALVPALRDLKPESVWIGFRPATTAPTPHIGRLHSSRLWLAYGHYRNGILLAPATCDRICREIGLK
jgi:glycine/D-amino acid oxidase-like deaminating enzyme